MSRRATFVSTVQFGHLPRASPRAANPRASRSRVPHHVVSAMADPDSSLHGTLRVYKRNPNTLVAFTSGPERPTGGTVVFVPGLTDGPMSLKYLPALADALANANPSWRLVQPVLSSSYLGFGVSDLATDVLELDALLDSIPPDDGPIALIGHSTGCQDTVAYLRDGAHADRVVAAVLQAPVSDRQAMALECGPEAVAAAAAEAQALVAAGSRERLMPRDTPGVFNTPITAARYASLAGRNTPDDMFSSDLTDEELRDRLGRLRGASRRRRILVVFSGQDEYVPEEVKRNENEEKTYGEMMRRFADAIGPGEDEEPFVVCLENGNHALDGAPGIEFASLVVRAVNGGATR